MAKIEFKPLADDISDGDVRKGEVLALVPDATKFLMERNGVNALDILVVEAGEGVKLSGIKSHGHSTGESEVYIIFENNGVAKMEVCPPEEEHCLYNDSGEPWVVIAFKTDCRVVLSHGGMTVTFDE